MATADLLLEIGTEEIPARFMPGALGQLQDMCGRLLGEERLGFASIHTFATPRRLILQVKGLEERQRDLEEKKKGPAREAAFDNQGNPTKAALGFARKLGLPVEELQLEQVGKGEYLVALHKIAGRPALEILPELLPRLLKSISFPKNMFWEKSRVRFARPLRWLFCLYGSRPVEFTYAGLTAGRQTRGHRFLKPGPLEVTDAESYFPLLEEAFVVVDQEQRSRLITQGVRAAAREGGGVACIEEELLQEVTFLVEYPHPVLCSFPESYLDLPREVLVTTMQSHQRYFPVEDSRGRLLPLFVTVSNNPSAPLENVRGGNERVLKARLADARFFYGEDLKTPLEEKTLKLKHILFQEELGTVYEKTRRLVSLTDFLAERSGALTEKEKEEALRAAYLSKADLATLMVGEFPELQGAMGKEYALRSGESAGVAEAILEHYRPRFAGDSLPRSGPGALVALADKADHLAGCFAVGIRPSGSQDPYALRRHSLGLLQILLEHNLKVPLEELLNRALLMLKEHLEYLEEKEVKGQILEFFRGRLRFYFQEKAVDYDIIDALLAVPLQDLPFLWQKAQFLQERRQGKELQDTATAYNRAANLAQQGDPDRQVQEELLQEEREKELYSQYRKAKTEVEKALSARDLSRALSCLAGLKDPLDHFFDNVLVMVEEEELRLNRLALLRKVQELYLEFADFSRIVFPGIS